MRYGHSAQAPTLAKMSQALRSLVLHHGRVVIYQRREDQSQALRTIIDGADGGARSDVVINDDGNPSHRRHGLAIDFHCEQCRNIGELTIAQHKGQTRHCVHAHHAMKDALHSRGLTDTEIAQITPTEALKILLTPDARAVREFVTAIVTQAKAALTASADPGLLQITRLHPDP